MKNQNYRTPDVTWITVGFQKLIASSYSDGGDGFETSWGEFDRFTNSK